MGSINIFVTILNMRARGLISAFARKSLFGYGGMVYATSSLAIPQFIASGAHPMFTNGAQTLLRAEPPRQLGESISSDGQGSSGCSRCGAQLPQQRRVARVDRPQRKI